MSWGDKGEEYRPDKCEHPTNDGCMWCCRDCNLDAHRCPGCGTVSDHKNTLCGECEEELTLQRLENATTYEYEECPLAHPHHGICIKSITVIDG